MNAKRVTLVIVLFATTAALAVQEPVINLEWRPSAQTVDVGDPVMIGLYAACNPGQAQLFRAADVVFTWNPAELQFLGVDNTLPGTAPLLSSNLPVNDVHGLNGPVLPPTDGDGYYLAWAALGEPITVSDAGTLLTTFRFTALAETPSSVIGIAASGGLPLLPTRVLGTTEAGTIVTGTLGSAAVEIVPEPATALALVLLLSLPRRR